jgi:hypothetical protein
MAKQCLFCPRAVDRAEHLWSDWILQDLKPTQPIRIQIGKITSKWVDKPEVRIKCVCQQCNNSWMSDLENENKPHILAMMHGKRIILNAPQQRSLTRWSVLKAMVLDGSSPKRIPFYTYPERIGMKPPSSFIPIGTFAWIGRLSVKAFHAGLTDTFGEINHIPKAFHGCVVTIIVGHLVIQVITMHVLAMFATNVIHPAYKPGAWDVNLLDIWPVFGERLWPPPFPFELKGTTHHIGALVNRWKIGENIG